MTATVYYFDDEQVLKVNGEIVPYKTAADIRNLLERAYEAGERKEGYLFGNSFSNPYA